VNVDYRKWGYDFLGVLVLGVSYWKQRYETLAVLMGEMMIRYLRLVL
jgi:hypothetical protein